MEFGELFVEENSLRSIKGELALPINEAVGPNAPFDRVLANSGTVCGFCHYDERPAANLAATNAFSSIAFRPRPESRVTIETLRLQSSACDWQLEPHRCEMLSAVFDGGPVVETSFPDSMATFF